MTWIDGSWDTVVIGGVLIPGRVLRLDCRPKRKVESAKEKGTDTPHTKDEGYEGADVDIDIELWRSSQWPALLVVLPALSPRQPGGESKPLEIVHPITAAQNVSIIYIKETKLGMPNAGRLVFSIKAGEWFPPDAKKKTQQGNNPKIGATSDDGGAFDYPPTVPKPDPLNRGANFP